MSDPIHGDEMWKEGVRLAASWHRSSLTPLPLDKATAVSQTIFSNAFSWMKKFCTVIWISLKLVPKVPIDNKWTLVQVMAWRRTGDKPLSEPMFTQFTDAYMQH